MDNIDRNEQTIKYQPVGSSEPILLQPTVHDIRPRPIYSSQRHSPKTPLDYLDILHRRKWLVISVFLMAIAGAVAVTLLMIPVFRSTATLEIREEARSSLSLGKTLESPDQDYFATQLWILQSRFLSENLLDRLKLDQDPEFMQQEGLLHDLKKALFATEFAGQSDEQKERSKHQKIIDDIASRVRVQNLGKSRLVRIETEAKNALLAQQMLQTYIDLYLEHNLAKRRAESLAAHDWLKRELTSAESNLKKSRNALVKFTTEHGIVSLEKDMNHITASFNAAMGDLRKAKENKLRLLASQNESRSGGISSSPVGKMEYLNKMREQLAMLETEYAQLIAVYSPRYPKAIVLKKKIKELRKKAKDMERNAVKSAVDTAKKEEELSQEAFEEARDAAMNLNSLGVRYAILKKEVETNEEMYHMLLQKAKEMEVRAGITGNNVTLLVKPTVPYRPVRPNKILNLAVGALIGLMGGVIAAFLVEYSDSTVRTPEDLQSQLNLPALGVIPDIKELKEYHGTSATKFGYEFLAHYQRRSPLYDALRNVQVAISAVHSSPVTTLIFSSARHQEGKTFLSVAMATVMSGDDTKVLLMDCDLRKPRLHTVFEMSNRQGLASLLSNPDLDPLDAIESTPISNLNVLTSGPLPENPVNLLMSPRMNELLSEYRTTFDFVILDCPPILGFSDVRILTPFSDGVIMVVRQGRLAGKVLRQAVNSFWLGRGKIIGAIINMAHLENTEYNKACSHYYHGVLHDRVTSYRRLPRDL